jgi:hypothetical protein
MGNFMQQSPTVVQLASTQRLAIWLAYRLQLTHIAGHRHFNPQTQCPGDNLFKEIPALAAVADLRIGIDGYMPPDASCTCCACNPE